MSGLILARKKPLVILDDFLSTYTHPEHHHARNAADFLGEKGLLPLRYDSDLFCDLNKLISVTIWSGSISRNNDYPKFSLSLDDKVEKSIEKSINRLDLEFSNCGFGKNGSTYARLVSKIPGMFLSEGTRKNPDRKSKNHVSLPDYLAFLTRNYFDLSNEEDKNIAKKVLADHLNILLQTKRRQNNSPLSHRIRLFENRTRESVETIANELIIMFNTLYPDIGLDEDSIDIYEYKRRDEKRYIGSIKLSNDDLLDIKRMYSRIDEKH